MRENTSSLIFVKKNDARNDSRRFRSASKIDDARATTRARDAEEGMGIFEACDSFWKEARANDKASWELAISSYLREKHSARSRSKISFFLLAGDPSSRRRTISMVPALFHSERHGAVSERASQKNISVIHVRSALWFGFWQLDWGQVHNAGKSVERKSKTISIVLLLGLSHSGLPNEFVRKIETLTSMWLANIQHIRITETNTHPPLGRTGWRKEFSPDLSDNFPTKHCNIQTNK